MIILSNLPRMTVRCCISCLWNERRNKEPFKTLSYTSCRNLNAIIKLLFQLWGQHKCKSISHLFLWYLFFNNSNRVHFWGMGCGVYIWSLLSKAYSCQLWIFIFMKVILKIHHMGYLPTAIINVHPIMCLCYCKLSILKWLMVLQMSFTKARSGYVDTIFLKSRTFTCTLVPLLRVDIGVFC